jgi:hypothetical protein
MNPTNTSHIKANMMMAGIEASAHLIINITMDMNGI